MKKSVIAIWVGVVLVVTASFSGPAHAGWFTGTISRIQVVGPTGQFYVYINGSTDHECGSKRVDYVDPANAGAGMIYSALLAYEAQGRAVQFNITSCSGIYGIFSAIEAAP